ncbi:MAG: hypothetical protein AB2792_23070 [Candidatus Thiodiazotropha sp.]
MSDRLRMDYINSLPQPFLVNLIGGWTFELHDIDVETGLMRINVMGKLDVLHVSDARNFVDADGNDHDPDTFYTDYQA